MATLFVLGDAALFIGWWREGDVVKLETRGRWGKAHVQANCSLQVVAPAVMLVSRGLATKAAAGRGIDWLRGRVVLRGEGGIVSGRCCPVAGTEGSPKLRSRAVRRRVEGLGGCRGCTGNARLCIRSGVVGSGRCLAVAVIDALAVRIVFQLVRGIRRASPRAAAHRGLHDVRGVPRLRSREARRAH